MNSLFLGLFFVFIVVTTAAVMAAMPWLETRGQCFAVTVPECVARDPRLEAERRAYASKVAVLAIACGAAVGLVTAVDATGRTGVIVLAIATIVLVIVPFVLMLNSRARVQAIKAKEGWHADRQIRTAAIGEIELPRPIPVAWELLHLPLALLALGLGLALLPQMPERVAIHFDAAGVADNWIGRGPAVVAMPVAIIFFMGIMFAGCHLMAVRSKRGVAADAPALTTLGYAQFTRAMTLMLLASGIALNAVFALLPLQFAGILSLPAWIASCLVVAAIVVGWALWISFAYGQNGSRAVARMAASGSVPVAPGLPDTTLRSDDDRFWHLGVFYANAHDAAVIVPKRFGIGWTCNWARPASWGIVVGFIMLTTAFVWLALSM